MAKESCKYFEDKLSQKFGPDYSNDCQEYTKNSYPYLYYKNNKKNSDDIYGYIGVLLFMGIHYLPQLINYWDNSSLYRNELPN